MNRTRLIRMLLVAWVIIAAFSVVAVISYHKYEMYQMNAVLKNNRALRKRLGDGIVTKPTSPPSLAGKKIRRIGGYDPNRKSNDISEAWMEVRPGKYAWVKKNPGTTK